MEKENTRLSEQVEEVITREGDFWAYDGLDLVEDIRALEVDRDLHKRRAEEWLDAEIKANEKIASLKSELEQAKQQEPEWRTDPRDQPNQWDSPPK